MPPLPQPTGGGAGGGRYAEALHRQLFPPFTLSARSTRDVYGGALELRRLALKAGRPDVATAISVAVVRFETNMGKIAADTAQLLDRRARDLLVARTVRPSSTRPVRLMDAIQSAVVNPSLAQVRPFLLEELNKALNPSDPSRTPYWPAIEMGKQQRIRRGLFYSDFGAGAGVAPDIAQRRVHPVFLPGKGPRMRTVSPIEPKRFLRDAYRHGFANYRRRFRTADQRLAADLARAGRLAARPAKTRRGLGRAARPR